MVFSNIGLTANDTYYDTLGLNTYMFTSIAVVIFKGGAKM
jgi:hypothetical protein